MLGNIAPESCFLAGTDVLAGDGWRVDIETVRVGDRLATDGGLANRGKADADRPT